jgi:predicted nuclease with TOPRIM domain
MLDDIEYGEYSDNHIAKLCHVGNMLVAAIRAELGRAGPAVRKHVRDGKEVLQKVREKKEKVVAPAEDKETEMELLRASVVDLMDDNAALKDKISIGLSGSSEEEKANVTERIKSLEAENALLKVEVRAITKSRDAYQTQVAEMMKQIARMKKSSH